MRDTMESTRQTPPKSQQMPSSFSAASSIDSLNHAKSMYNQRIINMSNMSDYATIGSPIGNSSYQQNLISPTGSTSSKGWHNFTEDN